MKKALFLCTANYYRSRFAEELFNFHAKRRGLPWIADSKGIARNLPNPKNPGSIASWAVERLRQLEIEPLRLTEHSVSVVESHFEAADLVIALSEKEHKPMMRDLFPQWDEHTLYWDVEDYPVWTSQKTFQRIEEQMENLILTL